MEFIHGRPPIGHVFCPTRLALDDENEYLCTVGLVVFIRAAPTPDFPQLMAAKMVAEHGGQLTDYVISQAAITPYIISCPTAQIRDRIVLGGTYSIPQTQIQFRVYEWRPRFGMAYNPTTHQAWIQILGLPLQAWTLRDVTAFVRNFGHPTQILPFGAAAGHYRDIVVLVATNHPSRIPLAYMYREGDYSAQVDIRILAWRPWENNYFQPPDNYLYQEGPQNQPQHHDDHTVSISHSSSSSNNAPPTEPTIDQSSWSPRSLHLQLPFKQIWIPKQLAPFQDDHLAYPSDNLPLGFNRSPPFVDLNHGHTTDKQKLPHLATKNPTCWCEPQGTSATFQTHPLSFTNHILITPVHPPRPALFSHIISTAAEAFITPPFCVSPPVVDLGDTFKTPTQTVPQTAFKQLFLALQSPLKPNRFPQGRSALSLVYPLSFPTPITIKLPLSPQSIQTLHSSVDVAPETQTAPRASPLMPSAPSTPLTLTLRTDFLTPLQVITQAFIKHILHIIQGPMKPTRPSLSIKAPSGPLITPFSPSASLQMSPPLPYITAHYDEALMNPLNTTLFYTVDSSTGQDPLHNTHLNHSPACSPIQSVPSASEGPTTPHNTLSNSTVKNLAKMNRSSLSMKRKVIRPPTRRSQRIQQRHQMEIPKLSSPTNKNRNPTAKVPFDMDAAITSLDAGKTIQILQATGLQVDSQLEQLIDDAIKIDQINYAADQSMPSTPLHDIIPPMTIPGTDILL